MAAFDSNSQSPFSASTSVGTQDVPPPPAPLPPVNPPAPVSPPVPPPPPPGPTASVIASQPKRSFSLPKPLLILLPLILVGLLAFVLIKTILPKVSGSLGGGATITYWGLWEDDATIRPLIDAYQQKNAKVKITYIAQSKQDYRERLQNAFASGKGPDLFRFHNTWVPMFKTDLDAIPSSVMSAAEFSQTYYPVVTSDMTSGAGLVGIPLEFDSLALFINEDIFQTFNKTEPKTWDDLRQDALDLTVKDENGVLKQSGVALGRTENVDHWPEILALMMFQNGARITNPVGTAAEGALQYFTVFSKIDGVWNETLPPSTQAFAGGKLAMYFGPSWRANEIRQQNPNLKFKVIPVPQLPKENASEPDITYASYWVEGVWAKSKSKAAAWDFLKFLSSADSLQKLYQKATAVRLLGEPYPRVDMASLLSTDPIVAAFVTQGRNAKASFLVSRTFDGDTGINSKTVKYYEDAINKMVTTGASPKDVLDTVAKGVAQVLSQYGLVSGQAK